MNHQESTAAEIAQPAPETNANAPKDRKRKSNRRRRSGIIHLRVDPEELSKITENATGCSLTTAEFLRRLGQNFVPPSKVDAAAVRELCQVAGDLGRLGGLLKLWIAEKQTGSQKGVNLGASVPQIDELWVDIQKTYKLLKTKIEGLS